MTLTMLTLNLYARQKEEINDLINIHWIDKIVDHLQCYDNRVSFREDTYIL